MNIEREAEELQKLKLGALRIKYTELVGAETKSNNRPYLIRRILQAMLSRAPATATSPNRNDNPITDDETPSGSSKPTPRARDPRIPSVGTVLEREHDGKTLKVKVLEDGFQFRGKNYRSLSAIAREATGTTWNGLLFFGLVKRTKGTA